jgi:hypothetical protein
MKSKITKQSQRIVTFPNILGLILATLILFEIKMDMNMCRFVNTPLGMIVAAIIVITLFVFVHPIVGILLVVYLYENVKHMNKLFNHLFAKSSVQRQNEVMKKMNKGSYNTQVEEEVIESMAPLIKKRENPNAKFEPVLDESISSKPL